MVDAADGIRELVWDIVRDAVTISRDCRRCQVWHYLNSHGGHGDEATEESSSPPQASAIKGCWEDRFALRAITSPVSVCICSRYGAPHHPAPDGCTTCNVRSPRHIRHLFPRLRYFVDDFGTRYALKVGAQHKLYHYGTIGSSDERGIIGDSEDSACDSVSDNLLSREGSFCDCPQEPLRDLSASGAWLLLNRIASIVGLFLGSEGVVLGLSGVCRWLRWACKYDSTALVPLYDAYFLQKLLRAVDEPLLRATQTLPVARPFVSPAFHHLDTWCRRIGLVSIRSDKVSQGGALPIDTLRRVLRASMVQLAPSRRSDHTDLIIEVLEPTSEKRVWFGAYQTALVGSSPQRLISGLLKRMSQSQPAHRKDSDSEQCVRMWWSWNTEFDGGCSVVLIDHTVIWHFLECRRVISSTFWSKFDSIVRRCSSNCGERVPHQQSVM